MREISYLCTRQDLVKWVGVIYGHAVYLYIQVVTVSNNMCIFGYYNNMHLCMEQLIKEFKISIAHNAQFNYLSKVTTKNP